MTLRPEDAWTRLEPWLQPLEEVEIARREALGRVLAEPLLATVHVPGEDVSAMDGYALIGEPPEHGALPVVATIAAGDAPGLDLPSGSTAAIMTGAPVPATADRVVPVELTDGGRENVRIQTRVDPGANIRRRGEIHRTGDTVLPQGSRISAGGLALVATHGYSTVRVHRPPRVAFLTTGDEVVSPETEPAPGQLRDSHTDFLLAAGRTQGLSIEPLGIAPDDPDRLAERIAHGLDADVLLIGGGVSMGEFDFVEDVLGSLGCELLFDRVAIQPGKPLVAARHPGGLVFGLPGNPASVMACFWLFVRPVLRRLEGVADGFWNGALTGRLTSELPPAKARDRFLPAEIGFEEGELTVRLAAPRGSHDLAAYARGSALVRIPADSAPGLPGDPCQILPLVDWPADRD